MRVSQISRRRFPAVLTALAAAAALLAGCTSTSSPSSSPSPSSSSSSSSSPSPSPESPPEGQRQAGAGVWDTSPASVAAIGDSITRAYDACSLLADCPEASWATGTSPGVDSLALRLLGDTPEVRDHTWNLARSGARVADLPGQAREAARHAPGLVTVTIGANDACAADVSAMTDVARFEEEFTEALAVIRAESPDTQVFVASVPDLLRLWQEGSESATASVVWQLADICPAMLADPGDESAGAAQRREAVRERVEAYNAALAGVCGADPLCRYDGGAVFDYPFTSQHLSDWDWFHPSLEGQRELASLAYEAVTRAPVQ